MPTNAALPEIGKVVNIIPSSHGAAVTGDYVSLKGYHKAYFILQYTGSGAANTVDVHLYAATDVAGTGVAVDQTLYNWWSLTATTAGMLLTDALTKGASGVTVATSVANQDMLLVIEVDPGDYPLYDCFTIHTDASNAANWQGCIAILVPGRYQQATPPSAIVD